MLVMYVLVEFDKSRNAMLVTEVGRSWPDRQVTGARASGHSHRANPNLNVLWAIHLDRFTAPSLITALSPPKDPRKNERQ